jgi:hypothetical protein
MDLYRFQGFFPCLMGVAGTTTWKEVARKSIRTAEIAAVRHLQVVIALSKVVAVAVAVALVGGDRSRTASVGAGGAVLWEWVQERYHCVELRVIEVEV